MSVPQPLTALDKVLLIEDEMRKHPQLDLRIVHHFSPGIYARELHIPAGTRLTGQIHKYAQLNILSKGDISVLVEDVVKRVQAPFTIVSPPGTKRIAYSHTDCVWTTIHHTFETDLGRIEDHFIAKTEAEYRRFLRDSENIRGLNSCRGLLRRLAGLLR